MNELSPSKLTTPATRREPERTCVGCRRRAPAGALARLVVSRPAASGGGLQPAAPGGEHGGAGTLILWGGGRARPAGRGASLHRTASCLRAALKSGAFARAFKARVAVGLEDEATLLQQLTGSEDTNS
jgi:predicted RNA-binding protein YlxR (DUF448 family)